MERDQDVLLLKVNVQNTQQQPSSSSSDFELTLSGSQIQSLQIGHTVRGHVSNFNSTYKIYQVYIDQSILKESQASDLYIEVTPCRGRVTFYVSNDYLSLFKDDKKVDISSYVEIVSQQRFGRLSTRVANVGQFKTLYIGIMSSNELYDGLAKQIDSFYEVRTEYVKAG